MEFDSKFKKNESKIMMEEVINESIHLLQKMQLNK